MKRFFTKEVLLLVACLGIISFRSHGQSGQESLLPKIAPESPNAASFERYGNYEVDLFTGLPNISIALFEAKSGGLSVPISLSYHASGIRVTDQSSWVGLGWSLNTGGMVSRTVQGKPDESATGYLVNFKTNVDGRKEYDYLNALAKGTSDGEPDIFSYNMPGGSGKFILQTSGDPLTIPYAPVTIKKEPTLESFDLTDERGVMYKFGRDKNGIKQIEYNSASTTAWMLTEMKAPNTDDYIEFTYKSAGQVFSSDISSQIVVTDGQQVRNALGETLVKYPSIKETSINQGGSTVVIYPDKIFFENGEIHFIQSTTARTDIPSNVSQYALDRIEVFEKVNGVLTKIRTIKFINTSYFTNAAGGSVGLRLDGVHTLDRNGVIVQKYAFQYQTNSFSWKEGNTNPLFMRDYWGFYNGATINNTKQTLIPEQSIDINIDGTASTLTIGGADRNPNPTFLTQGVLKRITYPTGGYTEFAFEPNRYYDDVAKVAKTAGGLRVSSISSYDGSSTVPVVKTYKYGLNESGYGQKNFFDGLAFYNFTSYHGNYYNLSECFVSRTRSYLSSSMEALESLDRSSVVYPYVTEYQGTPSSNNGRILYEFDNGTPIEDNRQAIHYIGMVKRIHNHWQRGHLTRKTTFENQNKKVTESINSYTTLNSSTKRVGLIAYEYLTQEGVTTNATYPNEPLSGTCGSNNTQYLNQFTYYDLTTGVKRVSSTLEHIYNLNDAANLAKFEKKVSYQYTFLLQVKESAELAGLTGEEVVTRYLYPKDYTTTNTAITKLQTQGVLNAPIEKYVLRRSTNGTNERVVSGQITSYKINEKNANQVVAEKIFLLETAQGISLDPNDLNRFQPSDTMGFTIDSRYKPYATFRNYDANGNLTEVAKEHDAPAVYLWGYNQTLPVAKISNATYAQVEAILGTGFNLGAGALSELQENNLRSQLGNAQVFTFRHKPLEGVVQIKDPNGQTNYYEYDPFSRLALTKDSDLNILQTYEYYYKK